MRPVKIVLKYPRGRPIGINMALRKIGTIQTACERFNIPLNSVPSTLYDIPVYVNPRLQTTLGKAKCGIGGSYSIEIHKCVFVDPDLMNQVLAHEVAHILAGIREGHSRRWLTAARNLGYTGKRCASEADCKRIGIKPRTQSKRIVGRCKSCGYEVVRSRALSKRRIYSHTACGGRIERVD